MNLRIVFVVYVYVHAAEVKDVERERYRIAFVVPAAQ